MEWMDWNVVERKLRDAYVYFSIKSCSVEVTIIMLGENWSDHIQINGE